MKREEVGRTLVHWLVALARRLEQALCIGAADLDRLLHERGRLLLAPRRILAEALLRLVLLGRRDAVLDGRRRTRLLETCECGRLLLVDAVGLEELVVGVEAARPLVVRLELVAVAVVVARAQVVDVARARVAVRLLLLVLAGDRVVDLQGTTSVSEGCETRTTKHD